MTRVPIIICMISSFIIDIAIEAFYNNAKMFMTCYARDWVQSCLRYEMCQRFVCVFSLRHVFVACDSEEQNRVGVASL